MRPGTSKPSEGRVRIRRQCGSTPLSCFLLLMRVPTVSRPQIQERRGEERRGSLSAFPAEIADTEHRQARRTRWHPSNQLKQTVKEWRCYLSVFPAGIAGSDDGAAGRNQCNSIGVLKMAGDGGLQRRVKQVQFDPATFKEGAENLKQQGRPRLSLKIKTISLLGLLCLGPYFFFLSTSELDGDVRTAIVINGVMSVVGFFLTVGLVPVTAAYLLRKDMFGLDINKKGTAAGTAKVPESLGLVTGIVFLTVTIIFQPFFFTHDHAWLTEYNAALMCICFMLFLGFVDDVLDIPWRVKLLLPSVAALPLLMAYTGKTTILIPKPLQPLIGTSLLELGFLYKLYMGLLAVFCTNSINILAGINGLEVGQTVVIACAILTFNIMKIGVQPMFSATEEDVLRKEAHMFSIFLMQPLVAVSLGLLAYNWYPSSVFVGDTFTYFAGMALAVVGILGHFSETLLVFFLPQILNFLYSMPQLFKIVPCPRHRLPRFDPKTNLLTGSNDMNLVNLFLRTFGQCTEQALCVRLLLFQATRGKVTSKFRFGPEIENRHDCALEERWTISSGNTICKPPTEVSHPGLLTPIFSEVCFGTYHGTTRALALPLQLEGRIVARAKSHL